ncbi:MAG: ribonuclease III [Alphaproteobacteria bacterium]|nr:ribonuclease III [Alphaproteobacteria bacterium]
MPLSLNYEFSDPKLLDLALTQSGVDNENNNERLEFLGDRVIGLGVAELLYDMFPSEAEGALAQRHAALVSTVTLNKIASNLNLFPHIKHTHLTAGNKQNVTADAFEAVMGAIYLDGGFNAARDIIRNIFSPLAESNELPPKDPKTTLQEFCQKNFGTLPEYAFSDESGPSHNPAFNAEVTASGKTAAGRGASKKLASLDAAETWLRLYS